jgi:hypothetical protein
MVERTDNLTGMYRFTSISRPIDPAYLTNRALLIVLPVVGLLSAGMALLDGSGSSPLTAALGGVLAAFAAWALTRELAPDHAGAAFVALALAWFASIAFGAHRVLLLFVALVLVRVVNRSTGLPLRLLDTLGVFGLCTWAAINTQQPLIILIASLAFVLDAVLDDPTRRHYVAAAACLPVLGWMLVGDTELIADDLTVRDWSLAGAFLLGVVLVARTSPDPVSYCDISPDRLDRTRVNAGLIVGLLVAMQAILTAGGAAWVETPVWACFVAVLISSAARQIRYYTTERA